jgi:hypothetical protein
VKIASRSAILAVGLVFVSIFVVSTTSITAMWLTDEVRLFGLVFLPTGIVAALLVLYCDWRARTRRHS